MGDKDAEVNCSMLQKFDRLEDLDFGSAAWSMSIGVLPFNPRNLPNSIDNIDSPWSQPVNDGPCLPWSGNTQWTMIPFVKGSQEPNLAPLMRDRVLQGKSQIARLGLLPQTFAYVQTTFRNSATFFHSQSTYLDLSSSLIVRANGSREVLVSIARSNRLGAQFPQGAFSEGRMEMPGGVTFAPDFTQLQRKYKINYSYFEVFSGVWAILQSSYSVLCFFFLVTFVTPRYFRFGDKPISGLELQTTQLVGY